MMADLRQSFSEAYCEAYKCPKESYEEDIFRRCFTLPFPLRCVARVIDLWKPRFFEDDRMAIRRLGRMRSFKDFETEIEDFRYLVRRDSGFFRLRLKLRVSPRKLNDLKLALLTAARPNPE